MKNNFVLFCIVAVLGTSCQKELTDGSVPEFWAITDITISNADSRAVIGQYHFEYDSVRRRATALSFTNPVQGFTKSVYPLYARDTVFLGTKSFIALDGSKRITQLTEANGRPGIQNGDYYYSYNGLGQMEERLLDDGTSDVIRTTFNYDKGDLVQYNQDFKGYPLANTASLSYLTAPPITGFGQYSLLEIFPELLLYMPCFNMGKPVLTPLSRIDSEVAVPAPPTPPFSTYYKNFVITSEGFISGFQTTVQKGNNPPVNTLYEFSYRSYK